MPGIAPSWASSRRQIRQSPNFLNTARGRPQRLQREYFRTGYCCVRAAFAISDFLAIGYCSSCPSRGWPAKGNPRPRSSASPCSSVEAVVVTATSRPRMDEMSS